MHTLVIFGASGRTGKAVAAAAEARGIEVRAFDKKNPSPEELRGAVRGMDAAVIVFGPVPPYTDIFCAVATRNIIQAMEMEGIRQLICQTGAMIGDYRNNRSFIFELFSGRFRTSNPTGYKDRVDQEEAVKRSSLEWTIVKPPRLTAAEHDVAVHAGENLQVGLLSSISRKSLGRFMIEEVLNSRYIRKAVFVKN